jgi:predicted pyridoxine 5'-phosphate oxidase superfamily flavin-nucleotide-binding protein
VKLDADMQRVVRDVALGFVATVGGDGTPNLSPKGTTAVWDDEHLVFLDICSPGTVANIEAGRDAVEVNVVDPILRKGYRFKGPATALRDGPPFDEIVQWYATERGSDISRVQSVVLIAVESAAALVSPAYDDGSSEAEIERRSLERYGLRRV